MPKMNLSCPGTRNRNTIPAPGTIFVVDTSLLLLEDGRMLAMYIHIYDQTYLLGR